ncbi:ubiquitin-specific protease otu1 [Cryptotrichosporon argae]
MAPVPIRLRHPRGVATLEVELDATVDDLRALVFSATSIPPDNQELKYGYPPRLLPVTSASAVLSSIPIARGEQIVVSAVPTAAALPPLASHTPTPAPSVKALDMALSAPTPTALPPPPPPAAVRFAPADAPVTPGESVPLPAEMGWLQLRIVPDDNSCLFSAVGIVFEGGIGAAQKLRRVVADTIRADPETYSDVMLGQPRERYIATILKPQSWGGAIELSAFANHYKTEISSFDVATGRCDRFGEGQYENRCVLVYSGIHYDALSVSLLPESPAAYHSTVFPIADQTILPAAQELVARLRKRHYYTDTANFDLRCNVCKVGLKGEKGATEHAKQTGHVEFGEY